MENITIAGRLGRDAEVRTTGTGDAVCSFTVAVDKRKGQEKTTNWYRVSLWGKRGSALAQYLTKGSSVTVIGEFGLDEYDGKPQLTIRANEIALQGGKPEGGQQRQERQSGPNNSFATDADDDSDIPF